jgi:hypothetical protein
MTMMALRAAKKQAAGGGGGLTVTQPVALWARTSGSAAATSASFSVVSGDLIVVGISGDNPGSSFAAPTNSGTAFTWTLRQTSTGYATTKMYTAPATASQSMTVTLPASSEKQAAFLWVVSGQHASPIGSGSGGADANTNVVNQNYTPQAAGSVTFVFASDWLETGVPTSSNLTNTVHGNQTGYQETFVGRKANATTSATSFNLDAAGAGGTNWSYTWQEILAA